MLTVAKYHDEKPQLINTRETAKILDVSEKSVWNYTEPRGMLPSVKIGSSVRYEMGDVRQFIENQKRQA